MIQVPFYRVSDLYLDAYFMDKVGKPYLRILLVKANLRPSVQGSLRPIEFDELISLLNEGYNDLKSVNINKERITLIENLIDSIYNVGQFMRRRENEIVVSAIVKLYKIAYEKVLERVKRGAERELVYVPLGLSSNNVILGGKADEAYTFLFNNDEKFRASVLSLLSGESHK